MKGKNCRLLIVGPLPNKKYNCQWGGATVLMKNFCDFLSEQKVKHHFVQTNKYVNPHTLQLRPRANLVYFILNFAATLPFCDTVMFNFSDHGTVNMFPTLSRIAHFLRKKVVLRKFGGSFDIYLQNVSLEKKRRVINAIKHSDLIFFETRTGIAHLKTLIGKTDKIHWFPNVRKEAPRRKDPKQFNKKLVFMSHVSNEKGVGDMLKAFHLLPSGYELDIYGAIKEKCYENFDWTTHHVNYKGEISSDEVLQKLVEYQLLLFPSSYREGYPGIIIEALSVGIPIISTRVGGIPEIIEDGYNGRLITTHKAEEIVQAICSIDESNYAGYCKNAYQTFRKRFESDTTNERILSILSSI